MMIDTLRTTGAGPTSTMNDMSFTIVLKFDVST